MLLASDVPDAWKRHQLKSVGRQLRHWTKKVRQPFGAPVSGVGGTGAPETLTGEDDFNAGPVQAWLTQLVKTAQGIERSASTRGPSTPGKKTTCTTQTQYHSECQKETAVHTRGEHG